MSATGLTLEGLGEACQRMTEGGGSVSRIVMSPETHTHYVDLLAVDAKYIQLGSLAEPVLTFKGIPVLVSAQVPPGKLILTGSRTLLESTPTTLAHILKAKPYQPDPPVAPAS